MRSELLTSHPHVRSRDGVGPSPRFGDLEAAVQTYLDVAADPLEATEPTTSLIDPTAAAARSAVRGLARRSALSPAHEQAMVLAASETVTNAWRHGRPPVTVRGWGCPGRLAVTVSDTGGGPHPLVGLLPASRQESSGHGLWILHQLLDDIHHRHHDDGYTVRFSAGSE